jgi:hypothetical protein
LFSSVHPSKEWDCASDTPRALPSVCFSIIRYRSFYLSTLYILLITCFCIADARRKTPRNLAHILFYFSPTTALCLYTLQHVSTELYSHHQGVNCRK